MRYLGRWAFNLLAGLSLLLFVAVVVFWVRGYWWTDSVTLEQWEQRVVRTAPGGLVFERRTWRSRYPRPGAEVPSEILPFSERRTVVTRFGMNVQGWDGQTRYGVGREHRVEEVPVGYGVGSAVRYRIIVTDSFRVPLWPGLAAGLMSAVWLSIRLRRVRRERRGRCLKCGYDLRATPERCPECGREAMSSLYGTV